MKRTDSPSVERPPGGPPPQRPPPNAPPPSGAPAPQVPRPAQPPGQASGASPARAPPPQGARPPQSQQPPRPESTGAVSPSVQRPSPGPSGAVQPPRPAAQPPAAQVARTSPSQPGQPPQAGQPPQPGGPPAQAPAQGSQRASPPVQPSVAPAPARPPQAASANPPPPVAAPANPRPSTPKKQGPAVPQGQQAQQGASQVAPPASRPVQPQAQQSSPVPAASQSPARPAQPGQPGQPGKPGQQPQSQPRAPVPNGSASAPQRPGQPPPAQAQGPLMPPQGSSSAVSPLRPPQQHGASVSPVRPTQPVARPPQPNGPASQGGQPPPAGPAPGPRPAGAPPPAPGPKPAGPPQGAPPPAPGQRPAVPPQGAPNGPPLGPSPGPKPAGPPQGAPPSGQRPAGPSQGAPPSGQRPAGPPQGAPPVASKPVGPPQGAPPSGQRPAGPPQGAPPGPAVGAKPAGPPQGAPPPAPGQKPAAKPQGPPPSAQGQRPPQGSPGDTAAGTRPAGPPQGPQVPRPTGPPPPTGQTTTQAGQPRPAPPLYNGASPPPAANAKSSTQPALSPKLPMPGPDGASRVPRPGPDSPRPGLSPAVAARGPPQPAQPPKQVETADTVDDDEDYGDEDFENYDDDFEVPDEAEEEDDEPERDEEILEEGSPTVGPPKTGGKLPPRPATRAEDAMVEKIRQSVEAENAAAMQYQAGRRLSPNLPFSEGENGRLRSPAIQSRLSPALEGSRSPSIVSRSLGIEDARQVIVGGIKLPERVVVDPRTSQQIARMNAVDRKRFQRFHELMKVISLSEVESVIVDMAPLNSYEFYARGYGRANSDSRYAQTGEDDIDVELQTDECDPTDRECQWPEDAGLYEEAASNMAGVNQGGSSDRLRLAHADPARLLRFLQKASHVFAALLEENLSNKGPSINPASSNSTFSSCYINLSLSKLLLGRKVLGVDFCRSTSQYLLVAYSSAPTSTPSCALPAKGLLCLWNISDPQVPNKILVCEGEPSCCCLSADVPYFAFAGTEAGSIVVWDLREPSSLHTNIEVERQTVSVRNPTYCTDCLTEFNHQDQVCRILQVRIGSDSTSGTSSVAKPSQQSVINSGNKSFQIASMDRSGSVNIWLLVELRQTEQTELDAKDFALGFGAHVKLLRSSQVSTDDIGFKELVRRQEVLADFVSAHDLAFQPTDPNQFILGTSAGFPVRRARFGEPDAPRMYQCPFASTPPLFAVTCLHFCPHLPSYFLAGYADGLLSLYHTSRSHPIQVWPAVSEYALVAIAWSAVRPALFFVLDNDSVLSAFDLLAKAKEPVFRERFVAGDSSNSAGARLVTFAISGESDAKVQPAVALGYDQGQVDVHMLSNQLWKPLENESEKLSRLFDTVIW